jgi:hypothetical protein
MFNKVKNSKKIKCDKCNFEITCQNYKKHYDKCDGIAPRRKKEGIGMNGFSKITI